MVRSKDFCRRFRHRFTTSSATFVVGFVALALGGCGVDRTGLEFIDIPDSGMHRGDASPDLTSGIGGAGGAGGSGAGGSLGIGGNIIVGGLGGILGSGGMSGAGGMLGSGGAIGAGGMIIGSGGMVGAGGMIGSGGMIVGTGGMIGAGGMIVGTGGMVGAGGTIVGTGGSVDGGSDSGTPDAGSGGSGMGGVNGGLGGMPGMGGAPGLGDGGAAVCVPACGPCQQCGASHTCEIDPDSNWDLAAIAASLNAMDPNVQPPAPANWDPANGDEIGGILPDPFVELDVLTPQSTNPITPIGHTAVIVDSLVPNWGALMPASAALLNPPTAPVRAGDLMAGGKNWLISVFDDDNDTNAGPFGETMCQIKGPLTPSDFAIGNLTRLNVASCLSISIKLTCHP